MFTKLKIFLEMIKFEHSVFALPFAFMGAILGSVVLQGHLPSWAQIGWITLAMVGARTAAMALNRVIDQAIDKRNPRTVESGNSSGTYLHSTSYYLYYYLFCSAFLGNLSFKHIIDETAADCCFLSWCFIRTPNDSHGHAIFSRLDSWACPTRWLGCCYRSIYMVVHHLFLNCSLLECRFRSYLCMPGCRI